MFIGPAAPRVIKAIDNFWNFVASPTSSLQHINNMPHPRVFVSSTFYDLKYIRAAIEGFISSLGFEPVLFEKGHIPFPQDATLDTAAINLNSAVGGSI